MEIMLKNVRLSFPKLHEPEVNDKGEKEYKAAFIMDPETKEGKANITALEKAVEECIVAKWADKRPKGMKISALKNGDETTRDEYEGMFVCNATNKIKPGIFGPSRETLEAESGKPYGGCYVNAKIDVHAWSNDNGKGVRASLLGVQFWKDGPAFAGGRAASADDFEMAEAEDFG